MHVYVEVHFFFDRSNALHITHPLNGGQIVCTRNYMCGAVQPIDFQQCLFYCIVFHFRCIFLLFSDGRFVRRLPVCCLFTLLVVALVDSHAVNWVVVSIAMEKEAVATAYIRNIM